MKYQRGFAPIFIVVISLILAVLIGSAIYLTKQPPTPLENSTIITVVDATTKQPIPRAKLIFTQFRGCPEVLGVRCDQPAPVTENTDDQGKFVLNQKSDGNDRFVKVQAAGYVESENVSLVDLKGTHIVNKSQINLELLPLSLAIKTKDEAIAAARSTEAVKQRPELITINDVAFTGTSWKVNFTEPKSKCDTYQPNNPNCVLWIELDAKTGKPIRTGP